jgi:hypothetical protein
MQNDFEFVAGQMLAIRATLKAMAQLAINTDDIYDLTRIHIETLKATTFDGSVSESALDGIADVEKWLAAVET